MTLCLSCRIIYLAMTKQIILIYVIIIVQFYSQAQSGFIKKIDDKDFRQGPISANSIGDTYYFNEGLINIYTSVRSHRIYQLDKFGDILNMHWFRDTPGALQSFVRNGKYYTLGVLMKEDSNSYYCIREFDECLNVVEEYFYSAAGHYFLGNLSGPKFLKDGSLVFVASLAKDSTNILGEVVLDFVVIDSALAGITKRKTYDPGRFCNAQEFIGFNDNLLGIVTGFPDDSLLANRTKTKIMVFDKNLNLLDTLGFYGVERPYFRYNNSMVAPTDNSVYMSGRHMGGSCPHSISVLKMNTQYEIIDEADIYCATVDTSVFTAGINSLDCRGASELFVAGTMLVDPYLPGRAVLAKLDSTLRVEWMYFYCSGDVFILQGIHVTEDGGCLMLLNNNMMNNAHNSLIIKVDNNGLITSLHEAEDGFPVSPILISPNPGRGQMRIDLGPQLGACQLELYDMGAQLAIQTEVQGMGNIINTSALLAGTYVYKISNAAGFAESGKWVKE